MSKFNGPWEIDFKQFETGIAIVPKSSPSTVVCEVWPHGEDMMEPDMEKDAIAVANARLIAASPDLLEACQALPDFDIDQPDAADFKDNASAFMNAMRLAREAVKKAIGD